MTKDYTIRTATLKDAEVVTTLLTACYPVLMKGAYDAEVLACALPLMTKANPKLLASDTFYVAQSNDGRIIGCGGWTHERPGTGEIEQGLAHIRHFATHPDWLGQGVARKLFEKCQTEASTQGAVQLECFSSLNAEGFYGAMGLKRQNVFDVQMGPDVRFPSVRMTSSSR